ncbi:TPA: CD3337/EF1877 family mobilome membrane protein [Listeria monocytogenes]|uniref:CD3337/EF1877 family mobilome membrane protein n=1 Tax=Listeria monocytogenes TaxID=1639 RepID=UPI0038776348
MKKKQIKKQKKAKKKQRIKQLPIKRKVLRYILMAIFCFISIIFLLASVGTVAHATGLVDETINVSNEYSKYGLSNYQLDFYVDNDWGWLPWNWGDGLGKSVMYGLYAITNFIWTISLYLSNATGYLVQEAYSLDFISQTSDAIGKNIQIIAGVSQQGFSTSGFYVGFLLILILFLGIYMAYTGLLKRETTKAVKAVLNFVVVFILSASFIAYAPDYIGKINDFSKDISSASLDVGTKITLPSSNTQGKDSVDMIRDSLFSVQVKQPWLLLQYGTTDVDSLGADRVEELLSTSPDLNNGEDREDLVKAEIEDKDNTNLTITKTITRLGTVFFLFFFNIGISIFVFLLTGIMIFSQVLFIIFAMFLPISFLLSMIPSFEGMGKRAVMKLFNVIMTRAGITLIITVAFSISSMVYSLSGSSPFFMIMFLQIVTFAGIYFKLGDLMSLFSLQSSDSQQVGNRLFRKPRMLMNRQARKIQRTMQKSLGASSKKGQPLSKTTTSKTVNTNKANHERSQDPSISPTKKDSRSLGKRVGEKTGEVLDTKNRVVDKTKQLKAKVKDSPTNAKYALYQGQRNLMKNTQDFTQAVKDTQSNKKEERQTGQQNRRQNIAQKRQEMEQRYQEKQASKTSPRKDAVGTAIIPDRSLVPKPAHKQTSQELKRQVTRPSAKQPTSSSSTKGKK